MSLSFHHTIMAILICLSIGTPAFAQKTVSQSGSSGNTLYTGVNNRIKITASDIPVSHLSAKFVSDSVKGNIQKDSTGTFIAHISNSGFCRIDVYNDTTMVSSQVYRCLILPKPSAVLGKGYIGGNFSLSLMRAQTGIAPASGLENLFKIESFTMTYETGGKAYVAKAKESEFTEQMKSFINGVQVNDKITIDDIILTGSDGNTIKARPLVFTIF